MSDFTWTGSTGDGNHDTAGNWLGGAAPSSTGPHNITFDRGNYSMTSNIAGVSYSIGTLTITPGFGGSIGSTSAAYSTTGNIAKILCAGRGQFYKIGSTANVGTSITNRCQINLSAGTQFVMSSGTWQYFFQEGGTLQAEAAAVVSTQCMLSGVRALLQTNGTAVTLLEADNASDVTTYRTVTTCNANAGSTVRTVGSAVLTTSTFTGSTFNIANTSAATHTTCNLKGGSKISLANCAADPTVTTLYQWSDTSVDTAGSGVTFTITTPYYLFFGTASGGGDIPA